MLRCEMTDMQSIKSVRVCATVMLDCIQLKVISMHNQLIYIDFTTEACLIFSNKVGMAHNDRLRSFNAIAS